TTVAAVNIGGVAGYIRLTRSSDARCGAAASGSVGAQAHVDAQPEAAARGRLETATVGLVDDDRADVAAIEQVVDACERRDPATRRIDGITRIQAGNRVARRDQRSGIVGRD